LKESPVPSSAIAPPVDFEVPFLREGDPGYDEARSLFNGAIDRHPALIARCRNAGDVAAAIALARREGLEISVRAGGHGVTGAAVAEGGMMIDLSTMKRIEVDPAARRALVEPGVVWSELDAATQEHGLAVTGGRMSSTGVAGLTLGSGSGWLERKYGLTCDSLVSATVVTADGRIVRAAAGENPELLWALKGGGGNFGVVTEFAFDLHPVGPIVAGGMLLFELDHARQVLAGFRDFIEAAPDEVCGAAALITAPPAPFVHPNLAGNPACGLILMYVGEVEEGMAALAPMRDVAPVAADALGPIPYAVVNTLTDEGNPWGARGYFKAAFMPELSDAAIDDLITLTKARPSPLTALLLQPLGGAFARVDDDATPLCYRSSARWCWHDLSLWMDPAEDAANVAFSREMAVRMAPHSLEAVYPNFVSDTGEARVRSFYTPEVYDRLVAVKRAWDPDNVFHLNQNIAP
jgi:FAD/FMN-containing dehydrogenase